MKTRGQNRYDADRMAAAEDELSFALRSLDDLEAEHRAGNVSDDQFERLHGDYVVRAADAARAQQREAKLRTRAAPRRRRTRLVLVAALAVAGTGTALAVQSGSSPRAAGQTITGNASLGTTTNAAANIGSLHSAAQAAMTKGDLAGALKSYLAAIDADPQDVEALTYAGWISYLGGVTDKSLTFLDAAVRVDPTYPDAHAFRGIVLFKVRHDRTGAIAELRNYLRIVPDGQMSGQVRAVLAQVQKS